MDENVTVAQVRPESTLYCLKNIPLDNTYQNTIAFNNLTAQRQYFSRHVKYTFNEMTYIRQNGNTIRVEKTADDMLDVNYLMFQTASIFQQACQIHVQRNDIYTTKRKYYQS